MTHPRPTHPPAPPRPTRDDEHGLRAGWAHGPGQYGVECACNTTFDGFDSLGEAQQLLDQHVADEQAADVEVHHTGIGEPNEFSRPLRPRLGEVLRDADRLLAQAMRVLRTSVDPASEPDVLAFPGIRDDGCVRAPRAHAVMLTDAVISVGSARRALQLICELGLPPVGSAIKFPARQDPEALGPASPVATPGGLDQTTRVVSGEEPTPGSAAAVAPAACESAGVVVTPGAGVSSGPSPRHTHTAPDGTGVARGAGPS